MRFTLVFFGPVAGITWAINSTSAVDHPILAMMVGCIAITLSFGLVAALARFWAPLLKFGLPAFLLFCTYAWFAPAGWTACESGNIVAEYTAKAVGIIIGGVVGLVVLAGLLSGSSSSGSGSGSGRDSRMFYEKHYSEWDAT